MKNLVTKPIVGELVCITRAKNLNAWLVDVVLTNGELATDERAEKMVFYSLGIVKMLQQANGVSCAKMLADIWATVKQRIAFVKDYATVALKGKQRALAKKEIGLLNDSFARWMKSGSTSVKGG